MTDEAKALVERLRDLQEPLHEWDYSAAADLIEQLITENAYLREALKEARAALGEDDD